jgi:Cu(I)/Ag(I) efflux system periplasmic protein CusF
MNKIIIVFFVAFSFACQNAKQTESNQIAKETPSISPSQTVSPIQTASPTPNASQSPAKAENVQMTKPVPSVSPSIKPTPSPIPKTPQPTPNQEVKRGDSKGLVTKINLEMGSIELDHEEIKGIMPKMIMEFFVKDKKMLDGLKVGDTVDFTLEDNKGQEMIVKLSKKQTK